MAFVVVSRVSVVTDALGRGLAVAVSSIPIANSRVLDSDADEVFAMKPALPPIVADALGFIVEPVSVLRKLIRSAASRTAFMVSEVSFLEESFERVTNLAILFVN